MRLRLPHNGWTPRNYQLHAWNEWIINEIKLLELIWPRRAGKDAIALHGTAIKCQERVANYWHMLPQQNQVRKAIWEAVNPHTGIRRIDEAFPHELRETTREHEMLIKFLNGSTWQCIGSDSYQSAIGSTPAGIVYSEWALSNPSASAYLRPILAENNGWEVKIGTPRGKNHAYRTYHSALKSPYAFAQLLTINDTKTLTPERLEQEKQSYIDDFGQDLGEALLQQEYYCNFESAILGAIWGKELRELERQGRYKKVPWNSKYKVSCVMDIGYSDHTSIWFYQVINDVVHIIDFVQDNLKSIDYFVSQINGKETSIDLIKDEIVVSYGGVLEGAEHRQKYDYENIWIPHDGRAKTFAAKGKSVQEQMAKVFTWDRLRVVPSLSIQDGYKAVRSMLKTCVFDKSTSEGFEAIKQYRYDYDDTNKTFKRTAIHDWTSHPSDALRYLAIAYKTKPVTKPIEMKPKQKPNIIRIKSKAFT